MKNYASRENCDSRAWWISTQMIINMNSLDGLRGPAAELLTLI